MRQGLAEIINFDGGQYRRTLAYDNDNLGRLRAERIRASTGTSWPSTANGGWANDTIPTTPASGDLLYDVTPGYGDASGYDEVGNRRSRTALGVNAVTASGSVALQNESGLSYDVNDRLHYVTPAGQAASYDANGNARYQATYVSQLTVGLVQPSVSNPDGYDFDNRLIHRQQGTKEVIILYDGDGNRVKKVVKDNGVTTSNVRYLVDDLNPTGYAQVLEEQDASGNPTVTYVYGSDLISQKRNIGTVGSPDWRTHYYGYDGQGTVRYLMNDAGEVTDSYSYDAFGILTSTADLGTATVNHYRYAGEQWDAELGMYYLRARYYHPDVDRFWSMDTFEGTQTDPLSLHKYLYAHANPVNGVDPSGHEFSLIGAVVTSAKIGFLAVRTAWTVYSAYDRAVTVIGAVQDLAFVIEALVDGIDDDDSYFITDLIVKYVQRRITQAGIRLVAGSGGKLLSTLGRKLAKRNITQAAMKRLNKEFKNYNPPSSVTTKWGTVSFKNKFPVFQNFLYKGKAPPPHTVRIELSKTRKTDFRRADAEAGISSEWRRKNGYTWHHNEDLGKMELVQSKVHKEVRHRGGVWISKILWPDTYKHE